MLFRDRHDAGRRLADALQHYRSEDAVVEGLARGGVPVAFEVAEALGAALDVLLVRKLGCPGQTELGLGAIGEGGVRLVNEELVERVGISAAALDGIAGREEAILDARPPAQGRPGEGGGQGPTVIVVDDGLATGYTARAAIEVMRLLQAHRVVLVVPVAPVATVEELRTVADDLVCLHVPPAFMAIGAFYDNFAQVPDDDVVRLLAGVRPAPVQKIRPTAGSS